MDKFKIKPLTKEQLILTIDRLTRFKSPEDKYLRVFFDLITGYLISPKFKKSDIEKMDYTDIKNMAEEVFNFSVKTLTGANCDEFKINETLLKYEKNVYKFDKNVEKLIKNKIDYKSLIPFLKNKNENNLKWLTAIDKSSDIIKLRQKEAFCFPIEKVLIVEGATEEVLLPEFAKKCGYDFDKNGVYVISAGGKNQVVKMYYKLAETLKLPIFILLDNDAKENLDEIKIKSRKKDTFHLLKCGEFEDLLPLNLIKRTIDTEFGNISIFEKDIFDTDTSKVKILEEIFKKRGLHEFKKVEFANMVKAHIKTQNDISDEIRQIIDEIRS